MNYKTIIIVEVIFLFILQCSINKNPVNSSSTYKDFAHGFWETVGGDTLVVGETGLIVYNWYAIDTKSKDDSVYVTWDDGMACTTTPALIKENIIEMVVSEINVKFTFKNEKEASATFETNENLYEKQLMKTRNDPTVLCE